MTMIFMIVLAVLVTVYVGRLVINLHVGTSQYDKTHALYLAEAGLNKAMYYLMNTAPDGTTDGSCTTSTTYPLGTTNTSGGCMFWP